MLEFLKLFNYVLTIVILVWEEIRSDLFKNDITYKLWIYCLVGRVFATGPETWVHSQVASYQRLLKWYLIPPCLTLSNKVRIEGKAEQSRERSSALPYTLV